MTTRRLGVLGFLAVWLPLAAAQGWLAAQYTAWAEQGSASLIVLGVIALQLAKVYPSLMRLADLGRAPDEAIYGLVPFLNIGLFVNLLGGTPRDKLRESRLATWQGQMLATSAWVEGMRRVAKTAPKVLLPTLVLGGVGSVSVEALATLIQDGIPPAGTDLQNVLEALIGVGGFGVLYAALKASKGVHAPYGGWAPVLLLVPVWSLAALIGGRGSNSQQVGLLLSGLPPLIASFTVGAVFSGLMASVWIDAALPEGRSAGPLAVMRSSGFAMIVVCGLRQQIDQIGFQILLFIPGIYFAVSYAFADLLVILKPAEAPMVASHALVRGIRSRVFKVLVIWLCGTLFLNWLAWAPFLDSGQIFSAFIGAYTVAEPWMHALATFLGVFPSWVCTLAMLAVLEEREQVIAQRKERAAEKRAAAEVAADPNPFAVT